MRARDLDLLIEAAKAAGKIARRHFRRDPEVWHKDGGAGPVTEADLEINAMLEAELRAARPDYGWLSEESADEPARLTHSRVIIVDPIDGTRAFIEGSKHFATALAIVEDGVPIAAAIHMPLKKRMFTAAQGQGAFLNGKPITASAHPDIHDARVLSARPNLKPEFWNEVPPVQRHFRSSLAFRLALVAQGKFDGMLTLRPSWEWDIAAGDLIVREAGGLATDRTGGALRFNNPHPQVNGVIAASGPVHAGVMSRIKPCA